MKEDSFTKFDKRSPLKKLINILLCTLSACMVHSQSKPYWQQEVNYTIDVSLNDTAHTLDGFERIEYINNSPDTLHFIWFHLWPNAFRTDRTAFSDQLLENGSTKFYFSNKEDRGYINRLDFKVNDVTASMEDHPEHIDIVKLVLPSPLPPGERINITTPFHVKIPKNFSRGGHEGQDYQVTQWYPKPAVYDRKGWHPIPYLDQGEFYSEFGKFDVSITLPENYVVAATGELKDEKSSSKNLKTLRYVQDRIHDFAWFASKEFTVLHKRFKLSSGKEVDAFAYFKKHLHTTWQHSLKYIQDAITTRSDWVGEYPYNVVSVVAGPDDYGGGMEYPTITLVAPESDPRMLEYVIVHEVTHNWFYGILASNERLHPWMDEGLNTYYDNRHIKWTGDTTGQLAIGKYRVSIESGGNILLKTKEETRLDQPINTPGQDFTNVNYNLIAYMKTGEWMELLEKELGKELFDKAMQEYYRQWQFRHPYPEDLQQVFESVAGRELDKEFDLINKKGSLPGHESKGWKVASPFSIKSVVSYVNNPSKDLLLIMPAIGFNSYDKFMIGAAITNYKLPPSRLQFLLVPMYATKSKQLTGLGNINYSFYPGGLIRKVDLFVNAAKFSMDEFLKEDGEKALFSFRKVAPGLRLTLNERSARSSVYKYIQWKSFFINEESYRIHYDTVINLPDTTITQVVTTVDESRTLNQLKFAIENNRTLYPHRGDITIEQGKDFVRAAFTGNYYFNYPKEGGLNVRLFAGKFFYVGSKTFTKEFETDRYHLNMTGANGFEDYTYSDYFLGRNKFEGLASQQIMMRDGGFKVRTDLYAQKVGKTDDWLAAMNFTTTIPSAINPLTILPIKIPLKAFLDVGTYAEAWDRESDLDRFIFDAGLQLSLFGDLVQIHMPLIFSRIYKDYIQSVLEKQGRFFRKISFTIDISNFSLRKINRELTF